MRKIFYIVLLSAVSFPAMAQIILYKDKDVVDVPAFTNSIEDFKWTLKSENTLDTLVFYGVHEQEINLLISNMQKIPNDQMGSPRYAFVIEYNNRKDTLYYYDFNDENYKNIGYMVQHDINLHDTDDKLRNYLFKHFEDFIRREYYYIPNSGKESNYIKH